MLDLALKATDKLSGKKIDDFFEDENLKMAQALIVLMIGDAANQVSPEFMQLYPAVPWRAIIGMRGKVVHDYLHIDYHLVWDVVFYELPLLIPELKKLFPDEFPVG
jgi:uncharacterized protein with HEPN domain